MDDIAAGRAAETLLAEHKANATFKPLGPPDRPATISDAYDIQERFVTLLRGQHGDAVGYKVGLTSAAMQTFCGIDHPIAGVVLASAWFDRERACGARISGDWGWNSRSPFASNRTCRSRACRLPPRRSRLTSAAFAPPSKSSTIAMRTMPASMCFRWWRIIPGTPASCCRNFATKWPDLASVPAAPRKDRVAVGEGLGRDILGHPFNSVAWLAAQLASRGVGLKAGEVVMTGSVMKTVFPETRRELSV